MWRRLLFPAVVIAVFFNTAHGTGSGSDTEMSGSAMDIPGSGLCMNSTVDYQPVINVFENVAPPLAIVTLTSLFGITSTYILNGPANLQLYTEAVNDSVTIYSNTSFSYSSDSHFNLTYIEQNEIDGTLCMNTVVITIAILEDIAPSCDTRYMLPCSIGDTVIDIQCNSTDHPQLRNITYSSTDPHYMVDEMNRIVIVQPIMAGNHSIPLVACGGGVIPKCTYYNITFILPQLLYFPNNTYHITVDTILKEGMLVPSGQLTCTEYPQCNDNMETIQYSTSTDDRLFSIFENGSVYVANRIDYSSDNLYNLSVMCNKSLSEDSVVISISNRKFEFSNDTYFVTLPENMIGGEIFLNVTLKWYPTSTTVTYNISDSLFSIDSAGGISVSSMQSLDFETANNLTIVVTATALYAEAIATIKINITDINDNLPIFDMSVLEKNISITEPLGSVVLNISAADNDTGVNQELTYTIRYNEVVDIHSNNGSVYVKTASIECYAGMTYVLPVTATDSGVPALSNTINITIRIESFAILFDSSPFTFNVTENTPISTTVGYLNASVYTAAGDDAGGGLLSYSINSDYFYIDPANGILYVSSIIDREAISRHNFNVTASLQCPNKTTVDQSQVHIFVTDQNDNRPVFNMSFTNLTLDQDILPATILYRAVVVDNEDTGQNSQISKYSISQSFNDLFHIEGISGNISISEVPTEYRDYLFDVFAEDDGTPSLTSHPLSLLVSGQIRTQVQNVHFEKDLYIFSVTENISIGSSIGILKLVYNRDPSPVVLTCSNCDNFTLNSTSMEIYTNIIYDREQQSSYAFSVTASVGGFRIAQTTISVFITDINDNIPIFSHNTYTRAISNSATIGALVLTISATDSDINENGDISYSLHPNNTPFGINMDGSIVTRYSKLKSGLYNIHVVATDKGIDQQLSSSAQLRITVFDQTKNFPFNSSSYHFTIKENSTIGSTVGSIFTSLNFTYQLVHNSSDSRHCFSLTNSTMSIITSCEMDREMIDLYYFQIEATSSNVTSIANIIVTVADVNDNPPVFEHSTYSTAISRSLPPGTIITTFKASDVDLKSAIHYYHNGPENYFKLNQSTGELTFNETNIERLTGSYSASVVASDGMLNSTVTYSIFIPYFNEELLEFDQSVYVFNLTENSDILTKLGTLVLRYRSDPIKESNMLSFEITDVVANKSSNLDFHINPAGELLTLAKVNHEITDFYNFTVTGYYGNTFKLTAQTSVVITIQDINDVAPYFNQTVYFREVRSTVEGGDALLTVTATDDDYQENGTVFYAIEDSTYLPSDRASVNDTLTTTFAINETSGVVSLQSLYHPTGQYRLTVVASDNSTIPLTSTALVLINIFDPIPANISFTEQHYNFSVAEGVSLLTPIGSISVKEMNDPGLRGIHYRITGGNGSDAFFVDPFTGAIVNTISLDREVNPYYTLRVTAAAVGVSSIEPSIINVSISVEDVNDEIPSFSKQVYNISRISMTENNSIIAMATATDGDIGDNGKLTYIIESGGNNYFTIDNATGVVYTNSSNIPAGVYPLTISAADHGLLPHTSVALVLVTIYHIPPNNISFSQPQYIFNITENSQLLTKLGNVSIAEMDHPGIEGIQYAITGGNGSEAFTVLPGGAISNVIITDREAVSTYTLTIEATAIHMTNVPAVNTDVLINVIDANDVIPVFNQSIYRVNFNTNKTASSSIITVLAYDEDIGSNGRITYRIVNNDQPFQINNVTGEIQNTASLIFESSYTLHVEASDQGTPSNTATTIVIISITLPTITGLYFPLASYTFNASENESLGTSLGFVTLSLHHGFPIENVVYSINSTVFAVDGNSGEIYTRQKLDRETFSQYFINLTAVLQVNNINLTTSTLVIVNVMDENDNAPYIVNLPNTVDVSEGSVGTQVFRVEVSDADTGNHSSITFSVTDEYFNISSDDGVVVVKSDIDRESENQHTLLIVAQDGGGLRNYSFLTINILDINDNIPMLLTGNEDCFVHERTENSSACNLIFTDHDLAENGSVRVTNVTGGGLRYSTVDNVHDNIFTLLVLTSLDYETNRSINVTVQFEDNGVPPNVNNKSLIIQVLDEPDHVPVFVNASNQQFEVHTIVTNGSRIFTILATDADDDEIEYAIVNTNPVDVSERFFINPFTGTVLIVALDPPFTPDSTVTLTISATDNSVYHLSSQSNVSISIIPNTLTFTAATYIFSLDEELPVNTPVGTIEINRDSSANDIVLSIEPRDVPFSIIRNSDEDNRVLAGTIQTTEVIDRDNNERDQFVFSVIASRTAVSETATATVTVNIQDINDNSPTYTGDRELSIEENAASSTIIANISATDKDSGENGTITRYVLVNNNQFFTISNQGVLRSNVMFDYETRQDYDITVRIHDSGRPTMRTSEYEFTINIINLNDNEPIFNHSLYYADIREDERVGYTLLDVTVEDKDLDPYSIRGLPLVIPTVGSPPLRLIFDDINRVGSSFPVILFSISPPPQSGAYQFELQATDGENLATSTLFVGMFKQINFIQFVLDDIPDVNIIAERLTRLIQGSLSVVYGSGVYVFLYSIEQTGGGKATMLFYARTGNFKSGGPIEAAEPITYVELDEELADEINKRISDDNDYARAGLSLSYDTDTTTPSATPTATLIPSTNVTCSSPTEEVFITSTTGFGAIAGALVACLALITCCIIACVYLRVKQRAHDQKAKRHDPYSTEHHFKNYKRKTKSMPPVVKKPNQKPNQKKREDRMELFSAEELSKNAKQLAYETMFQDEEVLPPQSMPWWDPGYLASSTDNISQVSASSGLARATVDGDKRKKRTATSDYGSSVDPAYYLTSDQSYSELDSYDGHMSTPNMNRERRSSLTRYEWEKPK